MALRHHGRLLVATRRHKCKKRPYVLPRVDITACHVPPCLAMTPYGQLCTAVSYHEVFKSALGGPTLQCNAIRSRYAVVSGHVRPPPSSVAAFR